MPFYADLHVHSKFARATSSESDLEHMALWAAKKGVSVLGTGDFTHPAWFKEIKEKLIPAEPGLFRLRPDLEQWVTQQFPAFARLPTRFLLEVEISTIYKKGDKTRKVHHLHYVPDLVTAERFIARLSRIGNLNSDGRPILGLDSRDLLEITLEAGEGAYLIPAHIWTPWFAALGSKSGFDSIEECYGDLTKHIFALETGLSSDPPMNWRLSQLDRYTLVSNSDAHSPPKIGREACKFDCELSYWAIRRALETGHGYGGTVEFFPEEGKYHLDGHRACGVCLEPQETKKHDGRCPACGKALTVGVLNRVDELADRPEGAKPQTPTAFRSLVPLSEVLAEILRVGATSRKVADSYEKLVSSIGAELFILEQAPLEDVRKAGSELLVEGIARMRDGRVVRKAGYDGEYGVIRVFDDDELIQGNSVGLLFDLPQSKGSGGASPDVPKTARTQQSTSPMTPATGVLCETQTTATGTVALPTLLHETSMSFLPLRCDPLAGLDPDQRAAAEITIGPLLIIAGPGTGKTRTLTHRIAHLITNKGVAPAEILAVTFTNRASNEMKERLQKLVPPAAESILVTTFHGLGHRVLSEHGERIGLPNGFRAASGTERRALLSAELKLSEHKVGRWLDKISEWKRVAPASRWPRSASPTNAFNGPIGGKSTGTAAPSNERDRAVLAAYESAMRERGWVDFDDLIVLAVRLFEQNPDIFAVCRDRFRHVSVDEFQDIDAWQYQLVKLLAPADGNVCVIGDPDQAIYSFRGGEPRLFQQFTADYPIARTIQLRRNYRSGRAIVQGALQAIAPVTLVAGRGLETLNADGTRITIHESPTDKAEAEFAVHTIERLIGGHAFFSLDSGRVDGGATASDHSFSDFAVLYRTDAQADSLCEAFDRSGIPFQRHSHAPLAGRREVQSLLATARSLTADQPVLDRLNAVLGNWKPDSQDSPEDRRSKPEQAASPPAAVFEDSEFRLLSDFVIRISNVAQRCGTDFARFESELALLTDADLWDARAGRVSLLTLHASKGLEFPVVFIVGCEDGLLPLRFGTGDTGVNADEERRLFFVGMTRARERLFLSHAKRRLWRGRLRVQNISPFVAAIERELLELSKADLQPRMKPGAKQLNLFVA